MFNHSLSALSNGQRGVLFGLLAAMIWSGHSSVSTLGLAVGLQPLDLTALRVAGAGLLLLPYLWRRRLLLRRLGLGRALALLICAGVPYSLLLTAALQFAPVSHNGVLALGLVPLFALLIKWRWLAQRPTAGSLQGGLLMLAGLALFGASAFNGPLGDSWIGDLMFISCGLMWALFGVLTARWQVPALLAVAICSVGSLPYLLAYFWMLDSVRLASVSVSDWLLQLIYQGPLVAGVAIYCYSRAAACLGAERAALFTALSPAGTALLGSLLLAQPVNGLQWLGILVLSLGILRALSAPAVESIDEADRLRR
ncbi:DMT family transporter [Marinobacterium arenosum]|uniref:DMT family transporter n=1 Tax=Marinobacterium arenosum TaxID=2862496 RepID=UPI001C96925B|nr:DMT family transporter [Marinobacterium arenosum]MBY4677746.1 DMT family transporter [Marinobacterium arenosum]